MRRVIQIGFHRCGTRSLTQLFRASGYTAAHWRINGPRGKSNIARIIKNNLASGRKPLHRFERYRFLSDMECFDDGHIWAAYRHFREIDTAYPGTVFRLNTRNKDDWLTSRLRHRRYAQRIIEAKGLSGIDACRAMWSTDWDEHLADVRQYFANRPDDLVEFDIDTDTVHQLIDQLPHLTLDADAWGHLGKSVPDVAERNYAALQAFVAERAGSDPNAT